MLYMRAASLLISLPVTAGLPVTSDLVLIASAIFGASVNDWPAATLLANAASTSWLAVVVLSFCTAKAATAAN